ncbi:MAG: CDP-glycerol glycerophosphotransferase family protein [Candidatus Asgardarchaeia archaeon]
MNYDLRKVKPHEAHPIQIPISRHNSFIYIFGILGYFVPKRKNKVIFLSTPDLSDNPKYVYDEMKKDGRFEVIWAIHKPIHYRLKRTTFVRYDTFHYFFHFLTSRYIISSHGFPLYKYRNQVSILLWHGIPLKTIGLYDKLGILDKIRVLFLGKKTNYFITTSSFTSKIFSRVFNIDMSKFIVLGQPRCDPLFKRNGECLRIIKELFEKEPNGRIIFYLPTFRRYDRGLCRRMVTELIEDESFRDFIIKNEILFLFKPHPKDEGIFEKFSIEKNLKMVTDEQLRSKKLTVYDLLAAVDILITDYSSTYFDFLLLNRPIVFYVPDFDEYSKRRGFILEPFDFWTPGDKARNVDELMEALNEAIERPDKYEKERLWMRDLLFEYKDGNSSERVVEFILKYGNR